MKKKKNLSITDLLFHWFNNRHWKIISSSILLEARHKQMYGRVVGLFNDGSGSAIFIYAPLNLDRKHTYKQKQPLFSCNVNSPDFFPKLEVFLKAVLKLHRKRISK